MLSWVDQEPQVITSVNRQAVSPFGDDRDGVIGQPVEKQVAEPVLQTHAEHGQDSFADPRTRWPGPGPELNKRHRGGMQLPVCLLSPIDTGDLVLGHGGG
jgi:hypothetical protein